MCGIYGKFNFRESFTLDQAIEALTLLEHRGPDGYGIEFGNFQSKQHHVFHNRLPDINNSSEINYFLGHRRLSIVDLNDNAFQPMVDNDERYSISFNGEIYNHIELREELVAQGHEFKTAHSDTEVLLHSYIHWGEECVKKLRGMFAFAIYDRENATVFIARDRIGQKTVYFELSDESFVFASELPPLLHAEKPRKISHTALNTYLAFGYIPHPYSIYENIHKLPPATYGIINLQTQGLSLQEYWDIEIQEYGNGDNSEHFVSNTQNALAEAVKYRLRADVSVGAFISGGIDSTLIVKNISEIGDQKFDIYGADFPETDRSEKQYIEEAANRYQQNLNLSAIDLEKVSNIESIVEVFDEPFDGASSIALFDLFKEASGQHKVILTGDGGDEMFAGYTRYITYPKFHHFIKRLKLLVLPKLVSGLLLRCGIKSEKIQTLHTMLKGNFIENYLGLNSVFDLTRLLKPQYRIGNLTELKTFTDLKSVIESKTISLVKKLQYLELKTILPGRMLYKLDRFSMYYGIEARSPFLDHKLAEMAFTIPDCANIENGIAKMVPKKILSQDFDDSFVHREKQGFGNPLSNWFYNSDPDKTFALLLDRETYLYNYLDYNAMHQHFPEIKSGYKGEREKFLWRLLVIAHFLESNKARFVDPVENSAKAA